MLFHLLTYWFDIFHIFLCLLLWLNFLLCLNLCLFVCFSLQILFLLILVLKGNGVGIDWILLEINFLAQDLLDSWYTKQEKWIGYLTNIQLSELKQYLQFVFLVTSYKWNECRFTLLHNVAILSDDIIN